MASKRQEKYEARARAHEDIAKLIQSAMEKLTGDHPEYGKELARAIQRHYDAMDRNMAKSTERPKPRKTASESIVPAKGGVKVLTMDIEAGMKKRGGRG